MLTAPDFGQDETSGPFKTMEEMLAALSDGEDGGI